MFWVTSSIFWVLWRRFFECFWNFVEAFKLRFLGHSSIKSHGRNALYWKSNWLRKQREGISELFESCNIESASNFVFGFWKVSFHNWESVTVRCNGELPWPVPGASERKNRAGNRFNCFTPMLSFVILLTVCQTLPIILVWRVWCGIKWWSTDIFLYSHHLSIWDCIYIVRRNSVLVTTRSERFNSRMFIRSSPTEGLAQATRSVAW